MPYQLMAPVTDNREVAPLHFVLTCFAPEVAAAARPGHFINTRIAEDGFDPLLRKPFSIYSADRLSGHIAILYSVVGATTRGMARKRPGDVLDLIGPLGGNLFAADPRPNARHIMAGGGYGVPPLVFLAQDIRHENPGASIGFFIGARTRDLLLCADDLQAAGIATQTTTEDGTCGRPGLITDALRPAIFAGDPELTTVYCCGSAGMMEAVSKLCAEAGTACQVSLEVTMPCGIGVCMGCVTDLADGRRVRCCIDGPVFSSEEVEW
jgi:dihydroorotate dehydrogenase electron transfer subunit